MFPAFFLSASKGCGEGAGRGFLLAAHCAKGSEAPSCCAQVEALLHLHGIIERCRMLVQQTSG